MTLEDPRVAAGEVFKSARIAAGLTLREFCTAHGLDPYTVSRMERGMAVRDDGEIDWRRQIVEKAQAEKARRVWDDGHSDAVPDVWAVY